MSLLTRGPHTVEVTPMTSIAGSMGSKAVPGIPVVLTGVSVQPSTIQEDDQLGVQARATYQVYGSGTWPGGALSRVRVLVGPCAGQLFDQHGPAKQHGMSPRTAHFAVVMTSVGSEAK